MKPFVLKCKNCGKSIEWAMDDIFYHKKTGNTRCDGKPRSFGVTDVPVAYPKETPTK